MSTEEVVKSVAQKLKYYFQIKRLEDGFDLSDVHQPLRSHPPLKARPAHQYAGLHDRSLKHYFSQPEVRVMLTQLNGQKVGDGLHGWREIEIRQKLDRYIKRYTFKKRTLQSGSCCHPRSAVPPVTGVLHRRKRKQKNISGGLPVLRTVPDQHISRAEANRLVNSATKIICGSEINNPVDKIPHTYRKDDRLPSLKLFQTVLSSSNTDRSKSSFQRDQFSAKKKADKPGPEKSRQSKETRSRSTSPRSTSASSYTSTSSNSSSSSSRSTVSRSTAERRSPLTIINLPELKSETGVMASTQTAADSDVDSKPGVMASTQTVGESDVDGKTGVMASTQTAGDSDVDGKTSKHKADDEVIDGPLCGYEIHVSTGDRTGAGTMAPVKVTLYGQKGRTQEFDLNGLSKTHKIPFQRGNEDLFLLSAHHVGQLRKIQIGHDKAELNYAWYLDKVTVLDKHAKRVYQFPCESWLSGQDHNRKTYRILYADSEREFMEALDVGMAKSALSERDDPAKAESAVGAKQPGTTKVTGDARNNRRPQVSGKESVDSSRISSNIGAKNGTSKYSQKGEALRENKDDYKQKATKITLRSKPDSNVVDEIFLENGSNPDTNIKQEGDSMEDSQLSISGQEQKMQPEIKRKAEKDSLKDQSIHDAVRHGDIGKVKDMLNHFPDRKDLKDDKGWTPLHLAASGGNMEILRWMVTSEADISAETPAGYTAMHLAALNGHVSAMMVLQAMGASVFSLTKDKQSTLHIAAKSGHLECVKWLVANRAPVHTEDSSGNTAFGLAEENRHESCANFLRICMQELSNPKSSFAQIHGTNGADTTSAKEDVVPETSENALKDNTDTKVKRKSIPAE